MRDTQALIHEIASTASPVKPIGHPLSRFLRWAVISLAMLSAIVVLLEPDPSVWNKAATPAFILPATLMLILGLICSLSAFVLAIPDHRRRFDPIPISAAGSSILIIVILAATSNLSESHPSLMCSLSIMLLSTGPAAMIFYMLRRSAPMNPQLIGLVAMLASAAFAEIGVQMVCSSSLTSHLLIWHFLPVCVIGGVGTLLGRIFLKIV